MHDVALGYDSAPDYLGPDNPYFGATVGRVANRIARGKFSIDGKEYQLAINNGKNHLHGGIKVSFKCHPQKWRNSIYIEHTKH